MVLGKKKKSQEISHFSLTSSKMKNRKEKKKKKTGLGANGMKRNSRKFQDSFR